MVMDGIRFSGLPLLVWGGVTSFRLTVFWHSEHKEKGHPQRHPEGPAADGTRPFPLCSLEPKKRSARANEDCTPDRKLNCADSQVVREPYKPRTSNVQTSVALGNCRSYNGIGFHCGSILVNYATSSKSTKGGLPEGGTSSSQLMRK